MTHVRRRRGKYCPRCGERLSWRITVWVFGDTECVPRLMMSGASLRVLDEAMQQRIMVDQAMNMQGLQNAVLDAAWDALWLGQQNQ